VWLLFICVIADFKVFGDADADDDDDAAAALLVLLVLVADGGMTVDAVTDAAVLLVLEVVEAAATEVLTATAGLPMQ